MLNIKLVIAYDGTRFLGWQKTDMGPSIEAELQKAIQQIVQHPAPLQAASRTDTGVHARGQVVNFTTTNERINPASLPISLNGLLPRDIAVLSATPMPEDFHPTLEARAKEYRYYLNLGAVQHPHERLYAWHVHNPLNIQRMRLAIPLLVGTRNFACFCNVRKNSDYKDYKRTVTALNIEEEIGQRLCISIKGDHFLYKMVRNIVGTLVDIGRSKINIDELPQILQSASRPLAGVTAPAHGLFLHEVLY